MNKLEQLLAGMKEFFASLSLPNWVKRVTPQIFAVTSAIRRIVETADTWVNSPTADLITEIIPADWDDKLKEDIKDWLAKALPIVVKMEDCCGDLNCMIKVYLESLKPETDKGAKAKYMALGSTMLNVSDDGKMKDNKYDTLAQMAYTKLFG